MTTLQAIPSRTVDFGLSGERAEPRGSGALWLPERRALLVADLHLGRSRRLARLGGALLPPYETRETLRRLEAEVAAVSPETVYLLGDSFDDAEAASAPCDEARAALGALAARLRLVWIAGNHDPRAPDLAGEHVAEARIGALALRHAPEIGAEGEVAGHMHPKATLFARGRRIARRCFLIDSHRAILPAFGAFTGGLDAADPAFDRFVGPDAVALMVGRDRLRAPTPAPRRALLVCAGR